MSIKGVSGTVSCWVVVLLTNKVHISASAISVSFGALWYEATVPNGGCFGSWMCVVLIFALYLRKNLHFRVICSNECRK